MSLNEFINQNVNYLRGGYRPSEVSQLIQLAWAAAQHEERERLLKRVDEAQKGD